MNALALAAPGTLDAFQAPTVEYSRVAPMLVVFGAAVVGVLLEAFLPRGKRYWPQVTLALVALVASFATIVAIHGSRQLVAEGSLAIDGPALFLQGTIVLLAIGSVVMMAERASDMAAFAAAPSTVPGSPGERQAQDAGMIATEVYPLTLFAVGGMMLFPAANDLLTMFVALEVLSLPLYLLSSMARRRRLLSQEAGLKYFLLGAFASAFFLFGAALLYGYAGTVSLTGIATAVQAGAGDDILLLVGIGMLSVGLLFKIGAAPFHAWTPDVYQGAPTPVTGFMAACTKVAAFGAMLRVFYVAFGGMRWDWRPMMGLIAVLTMVVGAVFALTQTDVKRMLAYSSIAHAGFVLVGIVAANAAGLRGTLFYLLAYGFTNIGAFAVVTLVRDQGGEATHLSAWAGLGKRSPLVAGMFAFFLLALAGIPLTSGFMGKFAVFTAAVQGGATYLVIVGVLASAVAAFFYVRVIVLMFFSEPSADGPVVVMPSVLTTVALALGVAVTLVLGVVPSPVLNLAEQASIFAR